MSLVIKDFLTDAKKSLYQSVGAQLLSVRYSLEFCVAALEGCASTDITCLKAKLEPLHALLRSAMSKGLWLRIAASLLLQIVVADDLSATDSFLEVAIFQTAEHLVVVISPDACIEVGKEFEADTQFVGLCLAEPRHLIKVQTKQTTVPNRQTPFLMSSEINFRFHYSILNFFVPLQKKTRQTINPKT